MHLKEVDVKVGDVVQAGGKLGTSGNTGTRTDVYKRQALSTQRNKISWELMMNSVEIVNDIRTACLSENKMTEKSVWKLSLASVQSSKQ